MRNARGVDEVFIPIWLQVRPNQFTIESGRETGRSVPEQGEVRFSSAYHSRSELQEGTRDDQ